MIRLILTEYKAGQEHNAHREDTGEFVCRSRQPRLDGARKLLESGEAPDTLITERHAGKSYDNFKPETLAECAKWTVNESEKGGLSKRLWRPHPNFAKAS